MVKKICAVSTCRINSLENDFKNLWFFSFPRDPKCCKEWIKRCGISKSEFSSKNAFICSQHFLPSDYVRDLMSELLGLTRKPKLKPDALPTANLPVNTENTNFSETVITPFSEPVVVENEPPELLKDKGQINSLASNNSVGAVYKVSEKKIRRRMVYKCSVPECRGNYDDGIKVSVFSFPRDKELRAKWEMAIQRANFVPTKHSKVCEAHFRSSEIERTVTAYDAKNAKFITAPLDFPRLVKGAIPSLFPSLPAEPSCSSARERPESKQSKHRKAFISSKKSAQSINNKKGKGRKRGRRKRSAVQRPKHTVLRKQQGADVIVKEKCLLDNEKQEHCTSDSILHIKEECETNDNPIDYEISIKHESVDVDEHQDTLYNILESEIPEQLRQGLEKTAIEEYEKALLEEITENRPDLKMLNAQYEENLLQGIIGSEVPQAKYEEASVTIETAEIIEEQQANLQLENLLDNTQEVMESDIVTLSSQENNSKPSNNEHLVGKNDVKLTQDETVRDSKNVKVAKLIVLDPDNTQPVLLAGEGHNAAAYFVLPSKVLNASSDIGDDTSINLVKKRSTCDFCGKSFINISRVDEDNSTLHKYKKCDFCKLPSVLESIGYNCVYDIPQSCPVCGECFYSKSSFYSHACKHAESETVWSCDICKQLIYSKSLLKDHILQHTFLEHEKDKKRKRIKHVYSPTSPHHSLYECKKCGKLFKYKTDLDKHVSLHVSIKYQCDHCGKKYKNKSTLATHVLVHSENSPNKCDLCGMILSDKRCWNRHMLVHSNYRAYQCEECGTMFKTKEALVAHRDIHITGTFLCHHCGKIFQNLSSLRFHSRTYHNMKNAFENDSTLKNKSEAIDKAFKKCQVCGKYFLMNNFLKHKKTHEWEVPKKCNICGKMYRTKYSLAEHVKTLHAGKEICQCSICGKSFQYRRLLREHSVLHTGVKNVLCSVCGKRFYSNTGLIKHKHTHSDIVKYECSICQMRFKFKNNMKAHIALHERRSSDVKNLSRTRVKSVQELNEV